MLQISREETKWSGYVYICDQCESRGESIAVINHEENCPVQVPDDVDIPVSESSEQLIQKIIRKTESLYNRLETAEDMMDKLDSTGGVRWVDNMSTSRISLGLGRTSHRGEFHRSDEKGVVLKLDPAVRWNTEHTPVSANIDELLNWKTAVETGTTEPFAEVFQSARDGMWLLMEECIPIRHSIRKSMKHRDVLYDEERSYTEELFEKLGDNGWMDPDYKNGNMGLTDSREVVIFDFGTGPYHVTETES